MPCDDRHLATAVKRTLLLPAVDATGDDGGEGAGSVAATGARGDVLPEDEASESVAGTILLARS